LTGGGQTARRVGATPRHDTLISPAPLAPDLQTPWSAGRFARPILQAGGHGFESRRLHKLQVSAMVASRERLVIEGRCLQAELAARRHPNLMPPESLVERPKLAAVVPTIRAPRCFAAVQAGHSEWNRVEPEGVPVGALGAPLEVAVRGHQRGVQVHHQQPHSRVTAGAAQVQPGRPVRVAGVALEDPSRGRGRGHRPGPAQAARAAPPGPLR
jgi:hypothetical protein